LKREFWYTDETVGLDGTIRGRSPNQSILEAYSEKKDKELKW